MIRGRTIRHTLAFFLVDAGKCLPTLPPGTSTEPWCLEVHKVSLKYRDMSHSTGGYLGTSFHRGDRDGRGVFVSKWAGHLDRITNPHELMAHTQPAYCALDVNVELMMGFSSFRPTQLSICPFLLPTRSQVLPSAFYSRSKADPQR